MLSEVEKTGGDDGDSINSSVSSSSTRSTSAKVEAVRRAPVADVVSASKFGLMAD